MRTFDQAEKRALSAKIEQFDREKQTKEQGLLRMKHSRRRSRISLSNWISTVGGNQRGYRRQLRDSLEQQAMQHTVDAQRPLKQVHLSNEQKEALRQKLT